MKPAHLRQAAPEAPVRVEFDVQFSGGPKGQRRAEAKPGAAISTGQPASPTMSRPEPVEGVSLDRIPKITKMLVLGHHFEKLVREGAVKNYAEIARLTGLSRARVTQIANLAMLAPSLQESIFFLTPASRTSLLEGTLRKTTNTPVWEGQQASSTPR